MLNKKVCLHCWKRKGKIFTKEMFQHDWKIHKMIMCDGVGYVADIHKPAPEWCRYQLEQLMARQGNA